ncbi:MAG: hypothetical protein M1823_004827 [Watsoniomyces obsoletus]|nr:MAG: hypothetical protein M1823_004827 [Watsoniomyces obsoletus]
MPPRPIIRLSTLTPFLYPGLTERTSASIVLRAAGVTGRHQTTSTSTTSLLTDHLPEHLNPSPTDYSRNVFTDRCTLTLYAGNGGHGCVSFLREKFVPNGPANGGDGGSGGNIYIQAVDGDTSLHKLARRGVLKAGRGRNGQGKGKGGERGEDLLLQVPVGTVVKETDRFDPVAIQEEEAEAAGEEPIEGDQRGRWRRDKWIMYPSALPSEFVTAPFPALPRPRRSNLTMAQPEPPISLDLSSPMTTPMLLAAGAMGGLGNPHFVTKSIWRPKFATRGEEGMHLTLDLELKILADVGLVGFPNAGKSTLLRALSKSRTRIGNWAFTTLQPNVGTVVLDDHKGRPRLPSISGEPRTRFTVADIPGLIGDAHLGRGLGLGFLRHVERAKILVFVVDLNQGDAVQIVERLWSELKEYEALRRSLVEEADSEMIPWVPFGNDQPTLEHQPPKPQYQFGPQPISVKPWCVIATKADLPETQENFRQLQEYLGQKAHSQQPEEEKGTGRGNTGKTSWDGPVEAIPVSAINGHGMERVVDHIVGLLDAP